MKELMHILAEADRLRAAGQSFALATVVKINGSTYRRPGARMLIDPQAGTTYGTISGGCLEQEVAQQAMVVLEEGTPQVHLFDLTDDDLILGFGIGCNGVVHVLIEPVPSASRLDPTVLLKDCLTSRQLSLLAQVIEAPDGSDLLGRRLLLLDDGTARGDLKPSALRNHVEAEAAGILQDGRHHIRQYEAEAGPVEVLFEIVRPPVRLVIFGAGHVVGPLVRMAKELAWPVALVGKKPPEVLAERFPQADEHLFLMHPEQVLDYVTLDPRSAAVVMNHHYLRDKTLVGVLLRSEIPYVGALGPRDRTQRMIDELRAEQPDLPDAAFTRIHGPVGLDIGTETPEEIALSIVAEIQAVQHERDGGKLRHRAGAIHETVVR